MPKKTYYEILGIGKNASAKEIKEAYNKLALKWHPDKNPGNIQEATEKFREIKKVYDTLSGPSSRASYDATLSKIQQQENLVWFDIRYPILSFTGREEELKDLHSKMQRLSTDSRTTIKERDLDNITVIVGPGGIGKSELAIKYAHKYYQDYNGNVVWIDATSNETLVQSFKRLAKELQIRTQTVDRKDEKSIESIVQDVYEYLGDTKSLFIFDNAVQMRSTEKGDDGIMEFLPFCLNPVCNEPYILITSCNQKWGDIEKLPLSAFHEKEAIELIKRELEIMDNSQDREVKQLVETLGCFPLALQQAVAYIKEEDEILQNVCSEFKISDYLKRYKEQTKKLLDFGLPEGDVYTETTITTWKTTFNKIKQKEHGDKSLKILEIISYFAPNNIPAMLFSELFNDIEELSDAIELLRQYSVINSKNGRIDVHTLTQQIVRIGLKEQEKEEEVLSKTLDLLKKPLQEGNCDEISNHVRFVLDHARGYEGLKDTCKEAKLFLTPSHSVSQTTVQGTQMQIS